LKTTVNAIPMMRPRPERAVPLGGFAVRRLGG
jgi:hypothetical protein